MAEPTAGERLPTLDVRTVSEASAGASALPRAFPEVEGYEILGIVREGGMGIVYKAWQVPVERPVALKMIRAGEKATPRNIARFHREAQAIGQLQHPNIVQLYEHGEADGRPFFSMEFLEGGSLSDRFRDRPQPPQQAAQLVQVLADAVHFCHQHNVIHRDLKPSNVLLTEAPGSKTSGSSQRLAKTANAAGTDASASETFDVALWTPKLSDFGLVKQLGEDSGQTLTTDVIGTPSYMAPEQAPGTPGGKRSMGAVTDVYGLGAILYWALTGAPPFRGATVLEVLDQVRDKDPVPPSQLHLKVPLDLETICLKCLRKDPARRYSTAQALSKDLGNFLAGREIEARPVSRAERAWRSCRRNPGLTAALATAVFFLVAGAGGSLFYAAKANDKAAEAKRSEAEAKRSEADARRNLDRAEVATQEAKSATELSERRRYGVEMHLAYAAWKEGTTYLVKQWLEAQKPKKAGEPDLRGFESRYVEQLCHLDLRTLQGHGSWLHCVAFSPDGRLVASGGDGHEILIWNSANGQLIRSLPERGLHVSSLAFSPDGRYLVSASDDPGVKLWDVLTWKSVRTMDGHTNRVHAVAFSPDGRHIVSGSADRTLRVWDWASGKGLHSLHTGGSSIRSIAFSPVCNRLATTSPDGTIRIWNTELWKELLKVEGHGTEVTSAAFSPDGKLLVTAGENTVTIWDAESLKERRTFHGHTGTVRSVAFSPDGGRVASAGEDCTVRTWNVNTGGQLLALRGHDSGVFGVTFSPDGRRLASASADGTVKIWDSASSEEFLSLRGHTRRRRTGALGGDISVIRVQYSPNGRWLASAGEDHMVRIWEPSVGKEVRTLQGHQGAVRGLAFSPDSKLVASASEDGTLRVWDVETGKEDKVLIGHLEGVLGLAFGPDGRHLVSAGKDKTVRLWDLADENGNRVLAGHEAEIRTVAISRDGRWLASGSGDGIIKIWDPKTCREARSFRAHGDVRSIAFSPHGERIASVGDDHLVKVWSTAGADEPLLSLPGHLCQLSNVEFSADGKRIISVSRCDLAVRIWDALSGQELITLPSPYGLEHVVMSPDKMQLAGGAGDGTIKIWNAYPTTAKRAIQREARSVVAYLFNQPLSEADVLSRIHGDVTITEDVRQEALALAKPFGRNLVEFEAHRLVGVLLAEPMSRNEAAERLRADKKTWAPVRERALALVSDYPEDAEALFAAALVTVVNAGANSSQYDLALEQANSLCGLKPDDPYSICILGIAQYRAKKYKDAVETLNRAGQPYCIEKVDPKDRAYFDVLRLGFTAMGQHDLGHAKETQVTLGRLREAMKKPMPYGQDRIAASVSDEAERALRTSAHPISPR
jgi:eukaryotic-like serine/threonine-protein kinase